MFSYVLNLGPNITNVHRAHPDVIVMFSGLAVCNLSLFGSTEESVAHLAKKSCLWGQELHTCGKGKKGKTSRAKTGWLLKTTDPIIWMNPILPTGLCGLKGGRGELSFVGDAVFTSSFPRWALLFDSIAAFFAGRNTTKKETFSKMLLCRFSTLMLSEWQIKKQSISWSSPPCWCSDIYIKKKKTRQAVVPDATAGVTSLLGSFTCSALSRSQLTSWFCCASAPGSELREVCSPSAGGAVKGPPPPTQDSAAGSFSKQTSEANDFPVPHWRWLTGGSCTCLSWMTVWLNSRFGVTQWHLSWWCLFTLCCMVVRIHGGIYGVCPYRVLLKGRHHTIMFWTRRRRFIVMSSVKHSTIWASFCTGLEVSSWEVSIAGEGGRGRSATSPTSSTVTKSLMLNGNGSNSSSVSTWRTDQRQVSYSNQSTQDCVTPIYKWRKQIRSKRLFFILPSWRQCWDCSAFHLSKTWKMSWQHLCSFCPSWLVPSSSLPSCLALFELSPCDPFLAGPCLSPRLGDLALCSPWHHSLSLSPFLSAPSPVSSGLRLPHWSSLLWPWHVCLPAALPRLLLHWMLLHCWTGWQVLFWLQRAGWAPPEWHSE